MSAKRRKNIRPHRSRPGKTHSGRSDTGKKQGQKLIAESAILERQDDVQNLVADVMRRNRAMYASLPHLDAESIAHDLCQHVYLNLHNFKPSKGAFSTWLNRVAWCKLHGLCRDRRRLDRRDAAVFTGLAQKGEPVSRDEEPDLTPDAIPDWLAESFTENTKELEASGMPLRYKAGRGPAKMLTAAQIATLVGLKIKLNTSFRGVCRYLRSNPQLLETLGLAKAPNHSCFSRIKLSVAGFKK